MAFRYELIHYPQASQDYIEARQFFAEIDPDLAKLFEDDFRAALQGLASGRSATHLYVQGSSIRWLKLRRFTHKIFFDPMENDRRHVLAVVSSRRHPSRILGLLRKRRLR